METAPLAPEMLAAGNLDAWRLFLQADPIVKAVMLMLVAASLWSWAIIFDKLLRLSRLRRAARRFEDDFWSGGALEDLYDRVSRRPGDPMAAIFAGAMREWQRSAPRRAVAGGTLRVSLEQRIDQVMTVTLNREMDRLERSMAFLASVGSTAPFIGLFGTVWGIINSFEAIAQAESTNLTVVAPGIAEALFATALGLVAAIPAAVFYNKISTDLSRYAQRLEGFCAEFSAILSRQLDETTG